MDGMKVETEPAKFCDWKQVWVGCAENGVLCNKPYQLILHASVADRCGCTKDPSQMTKKLRKEKRNVSLFELVWKRIRLFFTDDEVFT